MGAEQSCRDVSSLTSDRPEPAAFEAVVSSAMSTTK